MHPLSAGEVACTAYASNIISRDGELVRERGPLVLHIDSAKHQITFLALPTLDQGAQDRYELGDALWAPDQEGFSEACHLAPSVTVGGRPGPTFFEPPDWDPLAYAETCATFMFHNAAAALDLELSRELGPYSGAQLVDALAESRSLWNSLGVTDYELTFSFSVESDPGGITIAIRPGREIEMDTPTSCSDRFFTVVVDGAPEPGSTFCGYPLNETRIEHLPLTVDEAFEMIAANADHIWATFDSLSGHPRRFEVPEDGSTPLDWFSYQLQSLSRD